MWGRRPVVERFDVPTTWRRPHFLRGCFDVPTFWADPATSPYFLTSPHFSIGRTASTIALIVSGMALGLFLSPPTQLQPGINKNIVLGQHPTWSTRFRPPAAGQENIS